ncbi:hypothetical protein OE88DRAFT_344680 [Heliocybe sulcata]|uniref:Uncharacterized protein n=1 Tax=Heliocybe sulcata TaxID=5364 RepID=A0A5C3MZR6_9AGAM|nr:hypothetical protein OE88DRAFT_344680 [Heliocybe sulcata]
MDRVMGVPSPGINLFTCLSTTMAFAATTSRVRRRFYINCGGSVAVCSISLPSYTNVGASMGVSTLLSAVQHYANTLRLVLTLVGLYHGRFRLSSPFHVPKACPFWMPPETL